MSRVEATTTLFLEAKNGNKDASNRLFPIVYAELRSLAGRQLRRKPADFTLQPTALVHEVYLRLINQNEVDWQGRTHFFAIAASMSRRVLIDHARRRLALKRRGRMHRVDFELALEKAGSTLSVPDEELIRLDEALNKLATLNERQARVAELRYFAGLSVEDTAAALGVSPRTVKADWRFVRAWLLQQLDG